MPFVYGRNPQYDKWVSGPSVGMCVACLIYREHVAVSYEREYSSLAQKAWRVLLGSGRPDATGLRQRCRQWCANLRRFHTTAERPKILSEFFLNQLLQHRVNRKYSMQHSAHKTCKDFDADNTEIWTSTTDNTLSAINSCCQPLPNLTIVRSSADATLSNLFTHYATSYQLVTTISTSTTHADRSTLWYPVSDKLLDYSSKCLCFMLLSNPLVDLT